jgi:predicted amidohydrolase
MDIALGDPASNLAKVTDWVAEAAQRGSDMLVLPELWFTGYDLTRAPELASTTTDGLMAKLAELAAQHNIWLMGSTLISDDQPQPANRATLIDPHGEVHRLL